MEDYNTSATTRRGSFFGGGQRRGSLFGFHWTEQDEPEAHHRRTSLQERYREMENVSHQQQPRRGSFFGHGHHDKQHNHHHHRPTEKGRRASMFGSSAPSDDHHPRRGSLFGSSNHNRRGSIGPMATLSSVTAKQKRRGSFFSRSNKVHTHEPNSEDLAYQVMAAFADFDV